MVWRYRKDSVSILKHKYGNETNFDDTRLNNLGQVLEGGGMCDIVRCSVTCEDVREQ